MNPEEDSAATSCSGPKRLCMSGRRSARTTEIVTFHDYLHLKFYKAGNIDKDFRRLTGNRSYSVRAWIHPDREYSTDFYRPDLSRRQLDPDWEEEEVKIPIGGGGIEELKLHLEIVRGVTPKDANIIEELGAGPSNLRWVVGRVRMGLDGLEVNRWETKILRLMQKSDDGHGLSSWKPGDGFLAFRVMLVGSTRIIIN